MHTAGFWIPQGATACGYPDRLETYMLHAHCWFLNSAGRDCIVVTLIDWKPYMLHAHCWFLNSAGRDCIVVTLIDWKPYMLHAHWILFSMWKLVVLHVDTARCTCMCLYRSKTNISYIHSLASILYRVSREGCVRYWSTVSPQVGACVPCLEAFSASLWRQRGGEAGLLSPITQQSCQSKVSVLPCHYSSAMLQLLWQFVTVALSAERR